MISVTHKACKRITSIEKEDPNHYLRVYVQGGGCSGFKYGFSLDYKNEEDIELEGLVIVDPVSLLYLDGSVLDYETSLQGELFTISNPNVKSTCGCGESFGV